MFLFANYPLTIKSRINVLKQLLNKLSFKTSNLSKSVILTHSRSRFTNIALFVKDMHCLISKGIPEKDALEDARKNIGLSRYMTKWSNLFSKKSLQLIILAVVLILSWIKSTW